MERNPPTPVCRTLLLCEHLYHDACTEKWILVGPKYYHFAKRFPVLAHLGLWTQITSMQGRYTFEGQLRDSDGEVCSRNPWPGPVECLDPIVTFQTGQTAASFHFPHPGVYDLVLLANGEVIASEIVRACLD